MFVRHPFPGRSDSHAYRSDLENGTYIRVRLDQHLVALHKTSHRGPEHCPKRMAAVLMFQPKEDAQRMKRTTNTDKGAQRMKRTTNADKERFALFFGHQYIFLLVPVAERGFPAPRNVTRAFQPEPVEGPARAFAAFTVCHVSRAA